MTALTVIPGLTLTTHLYEAAAAGVTDHAPELPSITWETFTDPARWALIPDETTGLAYKAEHTLRDYPDGTLRRLTLWSAPDLRRDGRPYPHSHPWPFRSHILAGGYAEDRYTLAGGNVTQTDQALAHPAGTVNDMPRDLYHEVNNIFEPGQTLTLMIGTTTGVKGAWGHLDPDTAAYTAAPRASDQWRNMYHHLNPHLR